MQEAPISINTQSDEDLAALVFEIDPRLEYIKDMHPEGSSCRTLLVKLDGRRHVLKARAVSNNAWDETYFYYEIHALNRAAERNLSHVTRLVREYSSDRYHAVLKSYVEGTPCNKMDSDELLRDRQFIAKLDALYLKLHLAGIAKILFQPRKIVIDEAGELHLVDLSTCIVNTEAGVAEFSQQMRADSRFITRLERDAA